MVSLVMIVAMAVSIPAYGSELEELKAMVRQLQRRIEQLEQRQKMEAAQPAQATVAPSEQPSAAAPPVTAKAAAKPVTEGTIPGSILIPGTDTSLKLYGSARLDATYDFAGRNNDIRNNDWATAVFAQPLDTNSANRKRDGQIYATARTSRFGFVTSTPTPISELEIKLEADFNAPNDYMGELGSNGTLFRLRHAYGRLGNFLVGQTWSNFIDLRSYPDTVDFNPTGDVTLIRQAQVRYTIPIAGSTLALSVENPEGLTSLPPLQTLSNGGRIDFNRLPDFTANWTWNGRDAHISARAVTMEYRNDFRSRQGYAFGLGGSSRLGPGTLVAGGQGGEGIGRYMFNSIMQGATDTGTDLRLWTALGWHVGYTMPWTSSLRSNLIFSQTYFNADDAANRFLRNQWLGRADEFVPNKRIDQAFVNLFWGVVKNVEVGVEYAWGRRYTFGDEEGTQHRINAMVQYNLP
jgi:hypothetical protein